MAILTFVGIDPGKHGAVAFIDSKGKLLEVLPAPLIGKEYDIGHMHTMLDAYNSYEVFVVIERAQTMPKQGVVSCFSFGEGFGIWKGILTSLRMPYQIVHARVWAKEMLKGAPGEGKERGIHMAKRLFPNWRPKLKKELQYADSLLLAEFARRIYQ